MQPHSGFDIRPPECAALREWFGGLADYELPVSKEVQPAVRKAGGAEDLLAETS